MSNPAARTPFFRFLRSSSGRISPWWMATTFLGLMAASVIVTYDRTPTTEFGSALGDEIEWQELPEFNPNRL